MGQADGSAPALAGGQDAAIAGAVTAGVAGPIGREDSRACALDGATGYLEAANPGNVLDGKFITITAWIKYAPAGTSFPRIIDRVYNGQFTFYVYETGAKLGAAFKNAAGGTVDRADLSAASAVVAGTWQHAAVTWDGANLQAYIDGAPSGDPYGFAGTGLANSSSIVRIGQRVDGTTRIWEGQIAHVAVFDKVLTPSQIAALAAAGRIGA